MALATHFKARDASHCVATPGGEIVFDRLQNGSIRATLILPDRPSQVFERFAPLEPSAEDLAQ